MEYRQLDGKDVWHFHTECQHWPQHNWRGTVYTPPNGERPKTGELCNECLGKERADAEG